MTPQERQMVDELFDRLAQLENTPRDPDAERLIADGAKRAPHALYALVQTALVQEEALKRANARIEDLQAQLSGEEQPPQQQGGFLDSMREAVFGRPHAPLGSVPTVGQRDTGSQFEEAPGRQSQIGYPRPAVGSPPLGAYPTGPMGPPFGGGGSFLGTAGSAAAGAIGGGLLLDGIRSLFARQPGSGARDQSLFGAIGGNDPRGAATDNDLARGLGVDDIGKDGGKGGTDVSDAPDDRDAVADDFDSDDDGGSDGDDTDYA